MRALQILTIGIAAGWTALGFGNEPRETLLLNGPWEIASNRSPEAAPAAGWQPVEVPLRELRHSRALGGSDYAWFRKEIQIPGHWRGGRVFLWLSGARYHPRVWVDGQLAGEQLDGWAPCEVELTPWVKPGGTCKVVVCCQDWGATFAPGFVLPDTASGDLREDETLRGKVLAPIGGHWSRFGIWDDVELRFRPRVHLDDVAIEPSVREGKLRARGALSGANDDGSLPAKVRGRVREDGRVVLELGERPVGKDGRWTLEEAFPGARCWSPEDPHLYRLEIEMVSGEAVTDRFLERFGFRELWCEGPDFYLNGVKRHLLASSAWPEAGALDRETVKETLMAVKEANCVAFRLHTQPWQRQYLEVADEIGLMIIEEGALWCDGAGLYDYANPEFWDRARDHLLGMVRRDRNHACLVMWSLENELLHCGACKREGTVAFRLGELGRAVKALDPAHLITFEADLDPDGAADVIGLHYPHEMPEHGDYPNTADWMQTTVPPQELECEKGLPYKDYHWERKKPLYIGEYLWVPWFNPAPGTVFFGPEAYRLPRLGYDLAKAESWRHQTLGYRRAGVSGMCPWTFFERSGPMTQSPFYLAQKESCVPVAIYPRELYRRYYEGEPVRRTYDVFNDSTAPLALEARAVLAGVTKTCGIRLDPAGHGEAVFDFGARKADKMGNPLEVRLLDDQSRERHRQEATIEIFPRRPLLLPGGRQAGFWDPRGKLGWEAGDGLRRLARLEEVEEMEAKNTLLVIGPFALQESAGETEGPARVRDENPAERALRSFLGHGGAVLILEQETYAGLPVGAELVEHPSTMTFAVDPAHPVMKGLQPEDLKFWNPGHHVALRQVRRPGSQGARTLIVSGGPREMDQGPLVEVQAGPGRILLCQALAGTKWKTEPAAQILVENCLARLAAETKDARGTTWTWEMGKPFEAQLRALGVDSKSWKPEPGGTEPKQGGVLILEGKGGDQARAGTAQVVADFLSGGGNEPRVVYWHAPEADAFAAAAARLGCGALAVGPAKGPVEIGSLDHFLLQGLTPEEFVYPGEKKRYRACDPDPSIIDRCLTGSTSADAGTPHEAESMKISGQITRTEAGRGVWFATAGEAETSVDVARAGWRQVTVRAGGTALGGVFPEVALSVNGRVAGRVNLTQSEPREYGCLVQLPAGRVQFGVAFVNDQQKDGEDRNLFLDRFSMAREPLEGEGTLLIGNPPVLALIDLGALPPATGRRWLVIDCLRWDRAGANAVRGRRYASALLANLGVAFAGPVPAASWVEAKHFDAVGQIPHFGKTGSEIAMPAAGTARAEFECLAPGNYEAVLRARSQPAAGTYAVARLSVDGKEVGIVEVSGEATAIHPLGRVDLDAGTHFVEVQFTNDFSQGGEDRNFYFEAAGFRARR